MKYFLDFEFIEGFHKPLFGKRRHFIDLISIGIYCEDGREYYAISNEFKVDDADDWVKENVIDKLEGKKYYDGLETGISIKDQNIWKSNKQISKEIMWFVHQPILKKYDDGFSFTDETIKNVFDGKYEQAHEFYGYYSDYDWVLFCSLFGRMIDLPKGFPMYCIDLKQTFDEKQKWTDGQYKTGDLKKFAGYPKQTNEHNALSDAKWNYELYKFLQEI